MKDAGTYTCPLLEDILQAAEAHGEESEPDMEVGDLRDALRLAWGKLSEADRKAVHSALDGTICTWLEKGRSRSGRWFY